MDTYQEYYIQLDKSDIKHSHLVISECLATLQSTGLTGINLEIDSEQGVLYITIQPDIIQKQLSSNGKPAGCPREAISADRDTIRAMIEQYRQLKS